MREILFRGKDVKENWHIGLLTRSGNGWYISNSAGSPLAYEVIPSTVGQYTGLTDKNGTMIFEGDIVKENIGIGTVKFGDYKTPYRNVSVITQDIYSKHIGFYIEWINIDFRKDIGYWLNKIDVIGNIHDNPELLKEVNSK